MEKVKKTYLASFTVILTLFLIIGMTTQVRAQKYGGSAYVSVKDTDGNRRVLNTTIPCTKGTTSAAKSDLNDYLFKQKRYGEEYNGAIHYSIDEHYNNDKRKYGGSASVKVRDGKGKTRMLNTTISCTKITASAAKSDLSDYLFKQKRYEDYISPIIYDIDSCD